MRKHYCPNEYTSNYSCLLVSNKWKTIRFATPSTIVKFMPEQVCRMKSTDIIYNIGHLIPASIQ